MWKLLVYFVVFLVRMCMQCVCPRPWYSFVYIQSFSVGSNTVIFIIPTMTVRRSGEPPEFVVPDLCELSQAEERQAHHLLVLLRGGARGARHRARREDRGRRGRRVLMWDELWGHWSVLLFANENVI